MNSGGWLCSTESPSLPFLCLLIQIPVLDQPLLDILSVSVQPAGLGFDAIERLVESAVESLTRA